MTIRPRSHDTRNTFLALPESAYAVSVSPPLMARASLQLSKSPLAPSSAFLKVGHRE
jgi:hypothetical protein